MILADKIIRLRKKNGWSQEELAEKINVSRQAVSKWESAQTVPDLEKILMLGALFGVTTDYLLKDEIESEEFSSGGEDSAVRRLTLAEANEYLAWEEVVAAYRRGNVSVRFLADSARVSRRRRGSGKVRRYGEYGDARRYNNALSAYRGGGRRLYFLRL